MFAPFYLLIWFMDCHLERGDTIHIQWICTAVAWFWYVGSFLPLCLFQFDFFLSFWGSAIAMGNCCQNFICYLHLWSIIRCESASLSSYLAVLEFGLVPMLLMGIYWGWIVLWWCCTVARLCPLWSLVIWVWLEDCWVFMKRWWCHTCFANADCFWESLADGIVGYC